ncbi:MAG TPA: translocation/assembly module TamB domain-containing protein [Terriglobales bacterium]|jgi:translocation and assembly module TamB
MNQRRRTAKKIAVWIGLALLALVLLLVAALFTLPRIHSFRQYALRYAEGKLQSSLNTQIRVWDFNLSVTGLRLDLYDVVVDGANPYPNPPLLTADHLGLGIGISSLFRGEWYLRDITVDRPIAHVFVDANGRNNLPQPKPSNGQSHTDIFKLAIRHALLARGEVYYNDRKSSLDADLQDLTFQASFDPSQQRYTGNIAYQNGHLQSGDYKPIVHSLNASFDATPSRFTLHRALLNSGNSKFELAATVDDYVNPHIRARYSATVDSGEFRQMLKNPSLPTGIVNTQGSLDYQMQPNVPMLAAIKLDGTLGSALLNVQTPQLRTNITGIGAHYSLANGNAAVNDLHAQLLGGKLNSSLSIRDLAGVAAAKMHATVAGISLAQLQPLANSSGLKQVSLQGTVNADADATWNKSLQNLNAKSNATIQANVTSRGNSNGEVPLNSVIHAQYVDVRKEISLQQSYLRLPQSSLDLNGTVSNHSSLQIRFHSNDLHELETVAEVFSPAMRDPKSQLGLSGTAIFNGQVRGSTSKPQLTGQLQAADLQIKGSSWKTLRTNVSMSPSFASLQNLELQPADGGHITMNASVNLHRWSFDQNSPLTANLNASQVNIAAFTMLAKSQAPVTGMLSANLSVKGSEANPVANGNISLTKAKAFTEPLQQANLNFQTTADQVQAKLELRIPAGETHGNVTYFPKTQRYQAQLQAVGIHLEQLQTLRDRDAKIAGVVNITASGQGDVKNPQLTASIDSPQLQVRDQTLGDLKLQANLANHIANVALNAHAVNTVISAKATMNTTGDYQTDATIDTQAIPLQPLIAAYSPAEGANVKGQTELHLTLHGPLKKMEAVEAHATIPTLQLSYADQFQVAATSPIHVDLSHGVLVLQKSQIKGTGTDLQMEANVPLDNTKPVSILALGTVNLEIARMFNPDVTSFGLIRFDVNSFGARANLDVKGQVHIENANIAMSDMPVGLQNANGTLTLTKDRLDVNDFSGTVGGGKVQASGGIIYKPSLRFDLALSGKGIRLAYPDGVREALSANLTLTGTTEASNLGGQVHLDQLWFTPGFDLTTFIGQFGGAVIPPPSQGFTQNLQLNIAVQSTSAINVVSRELSLQGSANLNVRGTADQPVILGRVNLSGGDLIFMGNRYILQNGIIDFANPTQTEPVVNVAVNTTVEQYNIQLRFNGPVDHLRTNYTSDPSLPPSDIINLLAFGKTSEESAANTTPGNLGAESLIASQLSSQVTSRVEKIAGISRLSVDPVLGGSGSQQNPGARMTIQQRVTGNIFVTFQTDVTQTQNQVIELQYNVTPRVTISGTRDQNGGFGFDTRIKKTW